MESPSVLCQRCKVLQFKDHEHGYVKTNSEGDRSVVFNLFDEGGDRDGKPKSTESQLKEDVYDVRKQAIFLDYHLRDSFPDLPVLLASSRGGCGMCTAMREKILQLEDMEGPCYRELLIYKLCFRFTMRISHVSSNDSLSHLAVFFKLIGQGDVVRAVSFDIQADRSDMCKQWLHIERKPVIPYPLSDEWQVNLRELMAEASSVYNSEAPTYSPTRLIDVGDQDNTEKIKLVIRDINPQADTTETKSWDGKYVALSYCWGDEVDAREQLKTTKASLQANIEGIDIHSLPKTVAQAVLVCRALGVPYLWVDALCIVQDDYEDWLRESTQMAKVYSSAFVTLCALQSTSCRSGFLAQPQRRLIKVPFQSSLDTSIKGNFYICHVTGKFQEEYDIPRNVSDGSNTDSNVASLENPFLLALSKRNPFDCDVNESRWNTRGWTFQEALASNRLVFFGTRMVHILVAQVRRSQDGSFHDITQPWNVNFSGKLGLSQLRQVSFEKWRDMTEIYSGRNFSYQRDTFPALSSVAQLFASEMKSEYLAGMWRESLTEDILWAPLKKKPLEDFLKPPEEYIAPSWSWASQLSPVSWCARSTTNTKSQLELLSTDIMTGSDPYGKVYCGILSLRAKTRPIPSTKISFRDASLGEVDLPYKLTSTDGDYIASLRFDWIHSEPCGIEVVSQLFMILTSKAVVRWDVLDPCMFGLLVLPTDTPGCYTRAGIFLSLFHEMGGERLWEHIDPSIITLV